MNRISIKVIALGKLPYDFNREKIEKWSSKIFTITREIETFVLNANSDLEDWGFSDNTLLKQLPKRGEEDLVLVLTNVRLEENYYVRRLSNNTVILTFHEIELYLRLNNIPINNIVFRTLYAVSLVYLRYGKKIPITVELAKFTHDETRSCLFDMTGIKEEVIFSCNRPVVCEFCNQKLLIEKVSTETIEIVKREIKKIKKKMFFQLTNYIKDHPIMAIIISSTFAIVLGTIGSVIGSVIYKYITGSMEIK